jgi:hypothetical protein
MAVGTGGVDFLKFVQGESSQYSSDVCHDRSLLAQLLEVQR